MPDGTPPVAWRHPAIRSSQSRTFLQLDTSEPDDPGARLVETRGPVF